MDNNALRQTVAASGFTVTGWPYFPSQLTYEELRIAPSEASSGGVLTFRAPLPPAHFATERAPAG